MILFGQWAIFCVVTFHTCQYHNHHQSSVLKGSDQHKFHFYCTADISFIIKICQHAQHDGDLFCCCIHYENMNKTLSGSIHITVFVNGSFFALNVKCQILFRTFILNILFFSLTHSFGHNAEIKKYMIVFSLIITGLLKDQTPLCNQGGKGF